MNVAVPMPTTDEIVYPESDGLPMADNTKQGRWIVTFFGNLSAMFRLRTDVLVATNLFWYPVEGEPTIRAAPDVLVIFGRPKGDRGSYQQWKEGGVPVTVAIEILSPGNTVAEMIDKQLFYEEHGVEEYYLYDPDTDRLHVFVRQGEVLRAQRVKGFVSPRLGIRFDLSGSELTVLGPDGQPFLTFEELEAVREQVERQLEDAEQRAAEAQQRAADAQQRAARLADLSRKARRGEASADELRELEQLEQALSSPPG